MLVWGGGEPIAHLPPPIRLKLNGTEEGVDSYVLQQ